MPEDVTSLQEKKCVRVQSEDIRLQSVNLKSEVRAVQGSQRLVPGSEELERAYDCCQGNIP